jgi:nitroreductase
VNEPVLETIRRRRVVRSMTPEPVARTQLERVLEAARFAPNAGNRRLRGA